MADHPLHDLLTPDFAAFMANRAASQGDRLPQLVAADWLEEHDHPELAAIFRRHPEWSERAGRHLPLTPGVKDVFSSGVMRDRVFARHPIPDTDPNGGGGDLAISYRPWRVGKKTVPGLAFRYSTYNGRSVQNHLIMAPATREEVLSAIERYRPKTGAYRGEHQTYADLSQHEDLEPHEQDPMKLAATATPQGGNSVVVRVPLPQQTGGKPTQPQAAVVPAQPPARQPAQPATAQAPQPASRSFILPV